MKPLLFALLLLVACSPFPTRTPVHWHATVDITVCGDKVDLPRIPAGQGHLGASLLHTHDDNVIHVEGAVSRAEDITVGKFFQSIGLGVTATDIDVLKSCTGTLTAKVNGVEDANFLDYSVRDGDVIEIMYG